MSQFKKKLTAFTAMLAFLSLSGAALAVGVGDVMGKTGNVDVKGNDARLDVDVNSGVKGAVGQVDWGHFNVPKGQQVNFGFSNVSQTIINRVLGGEMSKIYGKLTNSCMGDGACSSYAATNKVILINPAGVMFGAGSTVDLNSFTASTFDIKGAKNINQLSAEQLKQYQTGTLNKFSPVAAVNGTGKDIGTIEFDSNYRDAFHDAGLTFAGEAAGSKHIDSSKTVTGDNGESAKVGGITLDRTNFDHFNGGKNTNKSVAIVSDNISYKDSLIRTGDNNNYVTAQNSRSMGNVRLITADGVSFGYLANGYIDDYEVAKDTKSDVVRNIEVNNSNLDPAQESIRSGNVHIVNESNAAGSNIKIANSIIKGTKLVNKENGDIMIVGSNDVNIDHSRLESVNTYVTDGKDTVTASTEGQNGGEIYVSAQKNATVKDSTLISAGAKKDAGADSGKIRIFSYGGTAKVQDSKVLANGDAQIQSSQKTDISGSLINAYNSVDESKDVNVKITAPEQVKINNSTVAATGNIDIKSTNKDGLSGDIVITGDKADQNKTLIAASKNLSIRGKNTRVENSSLAYTDLSFYGDDTPGLNNVTVAGDSTFSKIKGVNPDNGKNIISSDVELETNGEFTLDNATMKRASYDIAFDRKDDGTLNDDGTIDGIHYNVKIGTGDDYNLTVRSTEKNVTANNSNVNVVQNLKLESIKGNVNVNGGKLSAGQDATILVANDAGITNAAEIKAGQDANVTAQNGKLNITKNAKVNADRDVNLKSKATINFNDVDAKDVNIDKSARIAAGNNINITSTDGDINAERTTMAELTYGNRLKFDAVKGSNNFSSNDSLKSVNVDYVAGKANNFNTKGDIQFVDSSFTAKNNNVNSGKNVILNGLSINKATDKAEDTITDIFAKGNITSKDVTKTVKSDRETNPHTFPQQVNYDPNGQEQEQSVVEINDTKFKAKTNAPKATPFDTNGSIELKVRGAGNKNAGIELVAENEDGWDGASGPGEGPEVHIDAVDDQLAISRIVTDKLFMDKNDNLYASDVVLTPEEREGFPEDAPSKGYINVRDYSGFNMDDFVANGDNPDIDYTGHFQDGEIDSPSGDGKVKTKEKHTFDDDKTGDGFLLDYTRPNYDCEDLPDVTPSDDPTLGEVDSYINRVRIPREQVEISKTSKVSDNTGDQTSNIMSAAAKVDLGQENNSDDDDDKDKTEE